MTVEKSKTHNVSLKKKDSQKLNVLLKAKIEGEKTEIDTY